MHAGKATVMSNRQKPQIRPDEIGATNAGYIIGLAVCAAFGMRE